MRGSGRTMQGDNDSEELGVRAGVRARVRACMRPEVHPQHQYHKMQNKGTLTSVSAYFVPQSPAPKILQARI